MGPFSEQFSARPQQLLPLVVPEGGHVPDHVLEPQTADAVPDQVDDLGELLLHLIYGADDVDYTTGARGRIRSLEKRGYGKLPICIAKTQFSLSDTRRLRGRPTGFDVEVNGADASNGAGFIVIYMGDIRLMPGLPEEPAAFGMDVDDEGNISGVF